MVIKDNVNVDDVFIHKTLGEVTFDKDCLEMEEKYPIGPDQIRVRLESFMIATIYCEDLEEDQPENICGNCLKPKNNEGVGMCDKCIKNITESLKHD